MEVTVRFGDFGDFESGFDRAMSRTVRTAMFEIERRAKLKVPVDTGWLKNSIYTRTPDGNFSDQRPLEGRPDLPEEKRFSARAKKTVYRPGEYAEAAGDLQKLLGGEIFSVHVAAEYGIYLEDGTIFMEARPYLGPAFDEVVKMVPDLLAKNLKKEGLI